MEVAPACWERLGRIVGVERDEQYQEEDQGMEAVCLLPDSLGSLELATGQKAFSGPLANPVAQGM